MAGEETGIIGHRFRFKSQVNPCQLCDIDNLLTSLSTLFLMYKKEILIHAFQGDYENIMK